jgi:hypothetical protein
VSELGDLLWLSAGLASLAVAAGLVACCLRIRPLVEFVLATYVLAWAWLVVVTFSLSPLGLVTRPWLLAGVGAAVVGAAVLWSARGRPGPPPLRPALRALAAASSRPAVLVLAVAVAIGLVYTVVLALLTPVNEGDALAYHLARVGFWKQEHGVGYVADAVDARLNAHPPFAEIGQLATIVLSGGDRYVALPQLLAYGALVLAVAGLARRIGLATQEAVFGALAYATLPVVVVQASGALNDLVVASFLASAVLFVLRPGRAPLFLFALGLALAVGTKLTPVVALPAIALVVALGRRSKDWLRVAGAGLVGIVVGSAWLAVNLAETGELDGGLPEEERAERSVPAIAMNVLRLGLDLVDMSGAPWSHSALFLGAALVLGLCGIREVRRAPETAAALLVGAVMTASVPLAPKLVDVGQRAVLKGWRVLGQPETAPFERGWNLNTWADPAASWYGPLGFLLLVGGTVAITALTLKGKLPRVALALVAAPWITLLALAATVVWDPSRGRFLVFGMALAAATWGVLLRSPLATGAIAAIGVTALALSMANYLGKPSGLGALWEPEDLPPASLDAIWGESRPEAQARLREGEAERVVFAFVDDEVPTDAHIAIAPRPNDLLSPYFGARFSRRLSLVREDEEVPAEAEWLVVTPTTSVRRCRTSWQDELRLRGGWVVARRVSPDDCF